MRKINPTIRVDEQMRIKKESNIVKKIKWQKLVHSFQ
jgi:hypothetical protein